MTAQAPQDEDLERIAESAARSAKRARNATRDLTRDLARLKDALAERGIKLVMEDNDHGADGAKE